MDPIRKANLERITNGIYALTMILIVRSITIPVAGSITTDTSFVLYLVSVILEIIDFAGAFLILGMFWLFLLPDVSPDEDL